MNQEKGFGFFVLTMVGLGILSILSGLIFKGAGSANMLIGLVLDIIGVILVVWAGRSSKRIGGHPVGRGALMGAVYGLVGGITVFFMEKMSTEDLQGQSGAISSEDASNFADVANSTGVHVLTYIFFIVIYAVLGLVVSAIGGATAKKTAN